MRPKVVEINKLGIRELEPLFSLPRTLGLQILNLLSKGYCEFVISDLGDVIQVKAYKCKEE